MQKQPEEEVMLGNFREKYTTNKKKKKFIHPHVIPESSFLYYRGFFGGWLERNTVETGNTALFASERWSSVLLYWLVCTFLIHYRDSDTNTGFQNQGTSYSFQVLIQNRAEKRKVTLAKLDCKIDWRDEQFKFSLRFKFHHCFVNATVNTWHPVKTGWI